MLLLILGLAISIPFIVAGAALITAVLDRVPLLVWAGGGLLGWVAGTMIADDPLLAAPLAGIGADEATLGVLAVALVLGLAGLHSWRRRRGDDQA